MASNALMIPAIQKRNWETQMQKQMLLGSVYESFSNRAVSTTVVQNENPKTTVPNSVITYVSDKFDRGVMFTTIPSMDKLKKRGVGGWAVAQGTEENVTLRYSRVYYNVKRKAVTFADGTVEGDAVQAYPILNEKTRLVGDYFAELNDFDKHRALTLGGDEFLTETSYWSGSSNGGFNAAPVTPKLHPNTFIVGQSGWAPLWAQGANLGTALQSTASTGLAYQCNVAGVAARRFTKARLDAMIRYAKRNIMPLNWASKGDTITHVIVLTLETAQQLQNDTTTSGAANWWSTLAQAGERGVDNRTITGLLGIYQNCLIVVDPRGPLFNCNQDSKLLTDYNADTITASNVDSTLQSRRFQFVKPWADSDITAIITNSTGIDAGDNRVPQVKTDTSSETSGTMEVNYILGLGALGVAEVKKLSFHDESADYDFRQGFEARISNGNMRMDFTAAVVTPGSWASATAVQNWSSAMFLVPTTSLTM